jgi:hypothetical protein
VPYDAGASSTRSSRRRPRGRPAPGDLLSPIELRPSRSRSACSSRSSSRGERATPQPARLRHRHRQDGDGGRRLRAPARALPRARLLFVAHREEILDQSLATFRTRCATPTSARSGSGGRAPGALRARLRLDPEPQRHGSSTSTRPLRRGDRRRVPPRRRPSYERCSDHVRPVELLGLTATPERSDGLPVLHWFDGRIAAELRLWDAIDQHRLVPFAYYGIHDGLDLREVPWRRGRATTSRAHEPLHRHDAWARLVLKQVRAHVTTRRPRARLGFCVSVDTPASWPASSPSTASRRWPSGATARGRAPAPSRTSPPASERRVLGRPLQRGRRRAAVDTLLMLRPTDSPTLFLQQLGRGLRKAKGKAFCTVLDFVGQHRREFRFDRRFRALLGGSRRTSSEQVEQASRSCPPAATWSSTAVAARSCCAASARRSRRAGPPRWRSCGAARRAPDLGLRAGSSTSPGSSSTTSTTASACWSDLPRRPALPSLPGGPQRPKLRRACGRLLHVDDHERIEPTVRCCSGAPPVAAIDAPSASAPAPHARRLPLDQVAHEGRRPRRTASTSVGPPAGARRARELFACSRIASTTSTPRSTPPRRAAAGARPLHAHRDPRRLRRRPRAPRSRPGRPACTRPRTPADLLAFTLDKTSGSFSPTTRYRDYAISRELIHWESQSSTRADSETGLRYQQPRARSGQRDPALRPLRRRAGLLVPRAGAYVSHEGERPMAITW